MKNLIYTLAIILATTAAFSQNKKHQLSSHILDVSKGLPGVGVTIKLEKQNSNLKTWDFIDQKITDDNGRISDFLSSEKSNIGIYKLTYYVSDYFKKNNTESFYPFIEVVFEIKDNNHYHVPITLSAYGYSTYKGN